MKHEVVIVIWLDAVSRADVAPGDKIEHEGELQTTVGFLIKKDKTGISLATEYGSDGSLRDVHFIPKGMIKKITKL